MVGLIWVLGWAGFVLERWVKAAKYDFGTRVRDLVMVQCFSIVTVGVVQVRRNIMRILASLCNMKVNQGKP